MTAAALWAEPARTPKVEPGAEILEKYFAATLQQQDALKGMSMDVLMDAKLPKLKKEGRLSALRSISALGKITYKVLGFWGDDTVKREVMARFMTGETQTKEGASASLGINPENYKFKYKGLKEEQNQQVHVFELKPRHKRVGLFKGELWLDAETCMPVREQGRLVKNPSIFIKKMEFVRQFEIRDGIAIPTRFEGKTDTRIAGKAELMIEYANWKKNGEVAVSASWEQPQVQRETKQTAAEIPPDADPDADHDDKLPYLNRRPIVDLNSGAIVDLKTDLK